MCPDDAAHGRPPDVSLAFGHHEHAARAARRALRPLFDGPDDPIAADVELVASELVSNVVQHTALGGTVAAWDPKPDVPFRLEVADTDMTLPKRSADPTGIGGQGLRIVERLADTWGVLVHRNGKTVWAEFDRVKRQQRRASTPTVIEHD